MVIILMPVLVPYGLFVYLFLRELRLDIQRFREEHRLADEHFLRDVERFLKEKAADSN